MAARRNAQPPGEGLGEGSQRFDVRNLALEDWSKEIGFGRTRRPGFNDPARRPRRAADRFAHSAGPKNQVFFDI